MNRTSLILGVGLVAGIIGYSAIGADERERNPHLKAQACARDHITPAQCKHLEADHLIPICGHGPDVLSNIQMQPCDQWKLDQHGIPECVAGEAHRKDLEEWSWCAEMRHGKVTPEELASYFTSHKRCPPAVSGCW